MSKKAPTFRKDIIANRILRKHSRNKKIESVKHVKLTIPNQGIRVDKERHEIYIPSLKLALPYSFRNDFEKVNQIEVDEQYAHDKSFKCLNCGHVDHADANASFNIALRPPLVEGVGQLHTDRDVCKGSTDTPKGATLRTTETPEPPKL